MFLGMNKQKVNMSLRKNLITSMLLFMCSPFPSQCFESGTLYGQSLALGNGFLELNAGESSPQNTRRLLDRFKLYKEQAQAAATSTALHAVFSAASVITSVHQSTGAIHPAYAKRAARLDGRWGAEEQARIAASTSALHAMYSAASAVASMHRSGIIHPAYAKRSARLDSRWGLEELQRVAASSSALQASYSSSLSTTGSRMHPAYSKRLNKLDCRWGLEEQQRISAGGSALQASYGTSVSASGSRMHPAYAKRLNKLDSEEQQRISASGSALQASYGTSVSASGLRMHPAYAKRLNKLDSRWGSEEQHRIGASSSALQASYSSSASIADSQMHPAYAKRLNRMDGRWGAEEQKRVASTGSALHATLTASVPTPTVSQAPLPSMHPSYIKQSTKGVDPRWGREELTRRIQETAGPSITPSQSTATTVSAPTVISPVTSTSNVKWHSAYSKRVHRLDARWGAEEQKRVASTESTPALAQVPASSMHPSYIKQITKGVDPRWGREELARRKQETAGSSFASSAPISSPAAIPSETLNSNTNWHPAYSKRSRSAGIGSRWGSEELNRMAASTQMVPIDINMTSIEEKLRSHQEENTFLRNELQKLQATLAELEATNKVLKLQLQTTTDSKKAQQKEGPSSSTEISESASSHPAYVLRSKNTGLSSRWGAEELLRINPNFKQEIIFKASPLDRLSVLQELIEPNIPRAAKHVADQKGNSASSRVKILEEMIEPNIPGTKSG